MCACMRGCTDTCALTRRGTDAKLRNHRTMNKEVPREPVIRSLECSRERVIRLQVLRACVIREIPWHTTVD
eukprot:8796243-Alexandrium_andersonii.AAC.1